MSGSGLLVVLYFGELGIDHVVVRRATGAGTGIAARGAAALLGFWTVVRWSPRWWWAFGAAGAAVLVALLSFVLPVVVEV